MKTIKYFYNRPWKVCLTLFHIFLVLQGKTSDWFVYDMQHWAEIDKEHCLLSGCASGWCSLSIPLENLRRYRKKPVARNGLMDIEAALHRCSYKKMFWEYAANLQENTYAEVWLHFGMVVLL